MDLPTGDDRAGLADYADTVVHAIGERAPIVRDGDDAALLRTTMSPPGLPAQRHREVAGAVIVIPLVILPIVTGLLV